LCDRHVAGKRDRRPAQDRIAQPRPHEAPLQPTISHHFISEDDLAKLPERTQPPELRAALDALTEGSIDTRVARLREKVIADLVYVRGGSFMRGDFARQMGVEGVTRMIYNEDDKVVPEITLSDFWISRYKTTYAEFDVFTDATGRERIGMEYEGKYRHPLVPAGTYWLTNSSLYTTPYFRAHRPE